MSNVNSKTEQADQLPILTSNKSEQSNRLQSLNILQFQFLTMGHFHR